ncbi:MAG: AMP-binding protein, partial [Planctomycetales bacterium]|nr:AMP-binding protein [Planctomycetales bacterium]
LARAMNAIPIHATPKALTESMDAIRAALAAGELVCMFPEGAMTRDGRIQPFKRASLAMLAGIDAPLIPVYLDELFGSIFSYRGEKISWSRPPQWPYPVSIWFGEPLSGPTEIDQVQRAVTELGVYAVQQRTERQSLLPSAFLRQCRRKRFQSKIADSSGADLTGGNVLLRTLILRRLLLREVLAADEKFVGLLLPPSAGGVLANAALTLANRVAVNLNYTVTSEVLNDCIGQAGIKHVLTSRKVVEKLDLQIDAEFVYLEDFKDRVTLADKLASMFWAHVAPLKMLQSMLGVDQMKIDDPLTVIFTSGSTGRPKGVVLTQGNVLSNASAIEQVIRLRSDDVFIGILPFFHSFGYTVTLWTVLGNDVKGAYHFTPLEPRQVGKLCQKHRGTALLATPTFLRSYLRRCSKEDFVSLEVVVVGAEKMPLELAAAFEEKFGVRPVEGYGATELSPLVSVNIPPSRSASTEVDLKEGTVGRCVPGVRAKIVDPNTFEQLPAGQQGMLLIAGGNVMQGYLGQPEKTAEVIRDGWYITGDIAELDADGFIKITGRVSRFSKIGGEMVPHVGIEEEMLALLAGDMGDDNEEGASLFVAGVPDARKGERLVVLYKQLSQTPEEICAALATKGLPNLWIPSPDAFYQVDDIPILGTGKIDLKAAQQLAKDIASQG